MKVIMLSGNSNSGKTTTLNLVFDQLTDNLGAEVKVDKQPLGGNPQDFECELLYETKKIAIFTMGDFSGRVVGAMTKYKQLSCDILICACNDRFINPYKRILDYPNSIILDKTIVNTADMTSIINLI